MNGVVDGVQQRRWRARTLQATSHLVVWSYHKQDGGRAPEGRTSCDQASSSSTLRVAVSQARLSLSAEHVSERREERVNRAEERRGAGCASESPQRALPAAKLFIVPTILASCTPCAVHCVLSASDTAVHSTSKSIKSIAV